MSTSMPIMSTDPLWYMSRHGPRKKKVSTASGLALKERKKKKKIRNYRAARRQASNGVRRQGWQQHRHHQTHHSRRPRRPRWLLARIRLCAAGATVILCPRPPCLSPCAALEINRCLYNTRTHTHTHTYRERERERERERKRERERELRKQKATRVIHQPQTLNPKP